ncbi:PqqD family protein [Streptomyces sp. CA-250714]|uniref:PqqD family protein n=1 Tax=Streptomyces sp. CA-250714 TaxID=3240060 RepID=UPI003D8F47BF
MPALDLPERVRPASTVRATVTGHGAMLLDLRGRGRWYALTVSGARWWQHLADGATPEEAADRVADHYGAAPEQVRADMWQLTRTLLERRLLRPCGEQRGWWWR